MSWGITLAAMLALSLAVALYVAWPLLVGRPEERREEEEDDEARPVLDHLLVEKNATYSAIKELEFDHAMGNLSSQDYRELARRYEDKAVALLKTIDEISDGRPRIGVEAPAVAGVLLGSGSRQRMEDPIEVQVAALRRTRKGRRQGEPLGIENEIEEEVARLRAHRQLPGGRHDVLGEEIEQQVAGLRAARAATASPSSAPSAPAPAESHVCPACGRTAKSASAAFCSRCGAALATTCPVCGAPAETGDAFCSACGTSLAPRDTVAEGQTIVGGANV